MLFGNVFYRRMPGFFRWRCRPALQGEDHLAHLNLRSFFDLDFPDRARNRRRNFDDGFVGFQFHHRLSFGNFRARRNQQPHQVTLVDVFSQLGQPEFSCTGSPGRGRGRRCGGRATLNWDWRRGPGRRSWRLRRFRGSFGLGFRFGARAIFHGKDHLADLDLLSLFNANLFHRAGHRRRHLNHRLVGFQFHHRLAFSHVRAGRNHQPHQVALIDVLAEFR